MCVTCVMMGALVATGLCNIGRNKLADNKQGRLIIHATPPFLQAYLEQL